MEILSTPLKIVHYPHPSLKHKATPLTAIDANVQRIAEAMIDLTHEHKGLGLAAPQVGLPFRMFVAKIPLDPAKPDDLTVFLNPVIQDRQGSVEDEEGCLSLPGLYRKVRRARHIVVQAYDLQGRLLELKLQDLPARVWQHESDHLDGVLFIDKVSVLTKMTLSGAISEFEREHRQAQRKGQLPNDAALKELLVRLEASGPPVIPPREATPCVL